MVKVGDADRPLLYGWAWLFALGEVRSRKRPTVAREEVTGPFTTASHRNNRCLVARFLSALELLVGGDARALATSHDWSSSATLSRNQTTVLGLGVTGAAPARDGGAPLALLGVRQLYS